MKNFLKSAWRFYRRHHWWLWTVIAVVAALGRLAEAVAGGTKVSEGEFIFWVVIALLWMAVQFLTELRARRWQRLAEGPHP